MAATRADVARAAGVSPSTVTYVLTVAESTLSSPRQRVMRAGPPRDHPPTTPPLRTYSATRANTASTLSPHA